MEIIEFAFSDFFHTFPYKKMYDFLFLHQAMTTNKSTESSEQALQSLTLKLIQWKLL